MADLSTLDATAPVGSDALSGADDRIRETRLATKTSFNVEHALAGAHAFLSGAVAARPSAATSGRLYLNTTDNRIERDTGSAWNILHAVNIVAESSISSTPIAASPTYSSLISKAVDVPIGGIVLAIGVFFITAASGTQTVATRIRQDAADMLPGTLESFQSFVGTAGLSAWSFGFATASATAATKTYTLEASAISGSLTMEMGCLLVAVC